MNPNGSLPGRREGATMRRFYTGFHTDYPVSELERMAMAGLPIEVDGDALSSVRAVS